MKVIPIRPRGFCPGVVNAINMVSQVIDNEEYPRPITILGMIVHNHHVVENLTLKGVITLDDPSMTRMELANKIEKGTVIITAHGVSSDVIASLEKRHITVVNASCKDVLKTQNLVIQKLSQGFQIIYIGKQNHPETESVLNISHSIVLVETEADVSTVEIQEPKIFVTNQTTFSIRDIERIRNRILAKYPNAQFSEEICDSTRIRQEAILNANHHIDACFIVGDKRSNNSHNLVKTSIEETHTPTYLVESYRDITDEMIKGKMTVTVSSGASTPNEITQEVIRYLENFVEKG